MLVLPQKVKVRWNGRNKKWFIEKGYVYSKIGIGFEVDVLNLMRNSKQHIEVICDFCNKTVSREFRIYNSKTNEQHKDSCNDCLGKKTSEIHTKYTIEDVRKEFEKRNFVLLENEYVRNHVNMRYICSNGHETKISFKSLLKGYGCKKCASKKLGNERRRSTEEIKSIFEENNCALLTAEYKNTKQKLDYICECGKESKITLSHFLQGERCWECRSRKLREINSKYNLEDAKDIFKENNCILLEDEFVNSLTPMRYICTCGRDSKTSLANFSKGVRCKQCAIDNFKGVNHPNWNPNLTQEERESGRNIEGYWEWRKQVYERDDYTCQCCEKVGGNLNAHHLDSYDWCKEKRTDVDNGITLCSDCHNDFHHIYGYGKNTKGQFEKWIKTN